jgi:hypothetical protein
MIVGIIKQKAYAYGMVRLKKYLRLIFSAYVSSIHINVFCFLKYR